jgi:hypothetical protein
MSTSDFKFDTGNRNGKAHPLGRRETRYAAECRKAGPVRSTVTRSARLESPYF